MKRPILVALIGYILGIIWELYFNINIAPFVIILVIIMAFFKKNYKIFIIIIVSMIISNFQINYLNKKYDTLYSSIIENSEFIGIIISDRKEEKYYNTYIIKVLEVNHKDKYKNTKLIIKTKKELSYGDKIQFDGIYKEAEVARNFKGFSYKQYLRTQKIYGICEDVNIEKVIAKNQINKMDRIFHSISSRIKNNIALLLNKEEAGILQALVTGDNTLISDEVKENFRASGVYHILAISGMHMAYIILTIDKLLKKININKKYKKTFQIIGIIIFIQITTKSISVLRAGIMATLSLMAMILNEKSDTLNNISLSLLILLIINPFSLQDLSLQLSYGGVIGIISLNKYYESLLNKFKLKEKISKIVAPILSAQTTLLPISIMNFHTISLSFLIANLFSSFIIGVIIIIGFIMIIISFVSGSLSFFISKILSISIKLLLIITKFIASFPISRIYVIRPRLYIIILYYLVVLKVTVFKNKLNKEINVFLKFIFKRKLYLIVIFIIIIFLNIPKNLKIYFIDVGQGDSTLIITPTNKTILIDSGGTQNSDYDIGEKVLLPYLLDRGIYKLDYAIISHFDTDHVGGLLTVMEKLDIGTFVISKQVEDTENYQRFKEIVKKKKTKVIYVEVDDHNCPQKLNIEKDLYFYILWPDNSKLITDNVLNNNSIVCKLYYKNFSVLFTGDIEEIAEKKILQEYRNNQHILNSTILKVAHHGSKTSSTKEFLEKVKPKIALIGVGENNKFGHPNKEVIERLENIRGKNI